MFNKVTVKVILLWTIRSLLTVMVSWPPRVLILNSSAQCLGNSRCNLLYWISSSHLQSFSSPVVFYSNDPSITVFSCGFWLLIYHSMIVETCLAALREIESLILEKHPLICPFGDSQTSPPATHLKWVGFSSVSVQTPYPPHTGWNTPLYPWLFYMFLKA